MLFADNVRHVMMHSAQTRLWHGSSTGLCRIQWQSGHFKWLMAESDCVAASWTPWLKLKVLGAMCPICATNDCSDSLDVWPFVLSHFFFIPPFIRTSKCWQT